jgi:hypothetical protein
MYAGMYMHLTRFIRFDQNGNWGNCGERTGLLKAKSKNDMLDSKNYSQNFNNHVQKLI